ncbi:MAG TPA: LPXTG cell wall anchor domain-containing protein [Solirubrobacteraceae bacterium]|nr:LPXTG cell wall anchor domain-containing protein [Solirubrobacteraceae bacterium]
MTVVAALALLVCALLFAPTGSTQGGNQTLSPTPPVTLAPPSTASTPPARPALPKTGIDVSHVALVGLGFLACGAALRRPRRRPPPHRRSW